MDPRGRAAAFVIPPAGSEQDPLSGCEEITPGPRNDPVPGLRPTGPGPPAAQVGRQAAAAVRGRPGNVGRVPDPLPTATTPAAPITERTATPRSPCSASPGLDTSAAPDGAATRRRMPNNPTPPPRPPLSPSPCTAARRRGAPDSHAPGWSAVLGRVREPLGGRVVRGRLHHPRDAAPPDHTGRLAALPVDDQYGRPQRYGDRPSGS